MNYRIIGFVIGRILLVEAALLLLPMAVGLGYGESPVPFLIPMALLAVIGGLLSFRKPAHSALYARDGLAVVALAWIFMSIFGGLPFYISGDIPRFVDCIFETVSGFTTTGATILTEVEPLTRGGLFWRSFTHWVGGMGVLVFVMAILPMGGDGHGMHMLRAEMPGPAPGKLVSRMSDTAKILYGIYLVMTIIEIVLLAAPTLQDTDFTTPHQRKRISLVTDEPDSLFRRQLEAYLQERDIILDTTIELWSIETIKRCVMSDLGFTFLPRFAAREELSDGRLVELSAPISGMRAPVLCARHKNRWITPAMELFQALLRSHVQGIPL